MFRAGSNLKNKSAEEIFYQDFKKFILEEEVFGVGQINSMDKGELKLIKDRADSASAGGVCKAWSEGNFLHADQYYGGVHGTSLLW